ncbi:uncharacterized protein LOC120332566 [Styela clava]
MEEMELNLTEDEIQFEKERLERENASLIQEIERLGGFADSCFLPLKPDTYNEKTYSTEAVPPASTLTSLSSSSTSYAALPGKSKKPQVDSVALLAAASQSPNDANAKRIVMKSDFLQSYDDLKLNDTKKNDNPLSSLSEGALSFDQIGSEKYSTTPQRFFEPGRQIEIGRVLDKRGERSEEGTIGQSVQQQSTGFGSDSTLSKKLNFDSSEEEFENITKMTKSYDKKGIFGRKDKNWQKRVVGEIAFQLDRRILQHIFHHRRRLYGFTVRNISEKIDEIATDANGVYDVRKATELHGRQNFVMSMLAEKAEFDPKYHPMFSELLVNKYGILKVNPWEDKEELKSLQSVDFLTKLVTENALPEYRTDAVILLRALNAISSWDKKPILMW